MCCKPWHGSFRKRWEKDSRERLSSKGGKRIQRLTAKIKVKGGKRIQEKLKKHERKLRKQSKTIQRLTPFDQLHLWIGLWLAQTFGHTAASVTVPPGDEALGESQLQAKEFLKCVGPHTCLNMPHALQVCVLSFLDLSCKSHVCDGLNMVLIPWSSV